MKTNNIFRMLLVAVALLLGANNVKATETQIWPANGDANQNPQIDISSDYFTSLNDGDVMRIYVSLTSNQGQIQVFDGNWTKSLYFSQTFKQSVEGQYVELDIDNSVKTYLQSGIHIQGNNITIKHISRLVNPPLETGENIIYEGSQWFNNGWQESLILSTSKLKKASAGNTVRIYGTFNGGWIAQFKLDSEGWPTLSVWGKNGIYNQAQADANKVDIINNSYIEFPLTEENLASISAVNNFVIQGINFEVKKVVVYAASQQETTTYTVTVNAGSNGTASVDKTTAPAGETVTITTNPSSGYEVNTITGVDVTKTGTNTYTFTMPSNNVTVNVTFKAVTPAETVYASISSSTGYATFSSLKNLDFSTVTGLKAYIATNVSGDQVHLVQVKGVVPARTGLILKGTPNTTISIPVTTSDATLSATNLLRPGEGYSLALSPNYTDYVLVATETGVAFAEVYDSNHLPLITQDKAYLHITNNGARKRSLSITFPDDHTTGISNIENETTGDNVVYNLRGQRVDNPTKGIYIVNGKKVLFR